MQLHELQRENPNRDKKRVGRGGKRGKTSGRGHKGQKARAGTGMRPAIRDMIKKLPKLRGHGKNRGRTINSGVYKPQVVNVAKLEALFEAGDTVTPAMLLAKGAVSRAKGRTPEVKILGQGTLSKKLKVEGCTVSATAKQLIEAAGGSVA